MHKPATEQVATHYILGIDGLRALAVLSVIAFHVHHLSIPGGFVGVDIFLVISGYVVSASLARHFGETLRNFTIGFYARRIIRIYPALLVCLSASVLAKALFIPPSWLSATTQATGVSAYFGLSNFALIWTNDGYFSPRAEFNPFTHTWSLAVEEQFYLIFPFLFYFWQRRGRKSGLLDLTVRNPVAWLALVSLGLAAVQTHHSPDQAYYLLPSRFWELAAGALLYQIHHGGRMIPRTAAAKSLALGIGLGLIGWGLLAARSSHFPFPDALLPVSGMALCIIGTRSPERSALDPLLENGIATYIGKLSYSLYLWHWPVLVLFRWTTGLEHWTLVAAALAIIALAGMASYHLVEAPLRTHRLVRSGSGRKLVLAVGLTITCLGALGAAGMFRYQRHVSLSVTRESATWYPSAWSATSQPPAQTGPFKDRKLFIFGDSHAGAHGTMIRLLRDDGLSVELLSKGSCPVAGLIAPGTTACQDHLKDGLQKILEEGRKGDAVLLTSLRMPRLAEQTGPLDPNAVLAAQASPRAIRDRADALREANALVERLTAKGLVVVVETPKPVLLAPPFRCSDWFNRMNPVCRGGQSIERALLYRVRAPALASLASLKADNPAIILWDSFSLLCPDDPCTAFRAGKPLFMDGDHLSGYGNELLYPSFKALLLRQWSGKPAGAKGG